MTKSTIELVTVAQHGNQEAFAELVRLVLPRVQPVARLILRDHALAEEAVQDAIILAWKELPRLRQPESFEAWVRRLTVTASYALIRSRRRASVEWVHPGRAGEVVSPHLV